VPAAVLQPVDNAAATAALLHSGSRWEGGAAAMQPNKTKAVALERDLSEASSAAEAPANVAAAWNVLPVADVKREQSKP
jgi:hypothetical protein